MSILLRSALRWGLAGSTIMLMAAGGSPMMMRPSTMTRGPWTMTSDPSSMTNLSGSADDHRLLVDDHRLLVDDHRLLVDDHRLLVDDYRLLGDDHGGGTTAEVTGVSSSVYGNATRPGRSLGEPIRTSALESALTAASNLHLPAATPMDTPTAPRASGDRASTAAPLRAEGDLIDRL
jgi:hypothetical protein